MKDEDRIEEQVMREHVYPYSLFQKRETKKLFYFFFSILLFLLITIKQTEGKVTFKYVSIFPKNHPWSTGSIELGKQIAKKSGQDLMIEFLSPHSFKHPINVLKGIRTGKIDMASITTDVVSAYVKPMKIFNLPFLFHDHEQADEILMGYIGRKLLKEGKNKGFISLSFLPSDFPIIVNNVRPIIKMDDLQGLRIVTSKSRIKMEALKSLGAIPSPLPAGELYMALERGVVDGIEAFSYFLSGARFYEISKYMTELPIYYSPGIIVINTEKWNSLASNHQKIMLDCMHPALDVVRKELRIQKEDFIKAIRKKGAKLAYIEDAAPFKTATMAVYQHALYEVPKTWADLAYTISYRTFDLKVISHPPGADVYYSRKRKPYIKHKDCTICTIPNLTYVKWNIKVLLEGSSKEKVYDPFTEKYRVIYFSFEESKQEK